MIGKTAYHPIITEQVVLKIFITMLSILYYEHDYNTICHKNFIMIHLLVYGLGYMKQSYKLHCTDARSSSEILCWDEIYLGIQFTALRITRGAEKQLT